jgi:hypothetical protein
LKEISNIPASPCYTLSEVLDEYLINRGVNKKKYYARYLVIAKRAWTKLFQNTLWVTKNVWLTIQKGEPYNYVNVPTDCVRLFSVNIEDHCRNIQPLYYNSNLNVMPKPTVKKCGCQVCNCGGLCEDVNSFTLTTKLLFTINGVEYFEKQYLKYCTNGDILEYREIPVKKYNDFIGGAGDFNDDFNNDYSTGDSPLSNFNIVTEKTQRKICTLTVRPCGCPDNTPDNQTLLLNTCGCHLPFFNHHRQKHCHDFLGDINGNHFGEVKLSDCGTKIFFRPTPHHRHHIHPHHNKIPDFLLLNYQTNGLDIDSAVQVPDYAIEALFTSIDWRSKRFNGSYSLTEKQAAKYEFRDEENELILFLNALSLDFLANVQDSPVVW